jgi:hypothetical protein
MNLRNVFIVNAVLGIIFGLAFLLMPAQTTALYGVDLTEGGLFVTRLLAAEFITLGILAWLVREMEASATRQTIVMAYFISNTLGFLVSLYAQLTGVVNGLGWTTVIIYLLLALAFGYFQFMRQPQPRTT